MNGDDISGAAVPMNLSVWYRFSFETLESAIRGLGGDDATLELRDGEEPGTAVELSNHGLQNDDETFSYLRVLLAYQHEQLHLRHLTGSPIGFLLYMLGSRQYLYMLNELQAFGRRVASNEMMDPTLPLSVAHADEPEMVTINRFRSRFGLYHALFMSDMTDVTLAEARDRVLPSLFAELESMCRGALGVTNVYPPVTLAGADDQPCSIGATTGEAVLEGLARANEYLMAAGLGASAEMINRYIAIKQHGIYAVTNAVANEALGLSGERTWPVVARLSDWALQAPVLPFLLAGRTRVGLPELLPAWRFILLVSRCDLLGMSPDDIIGSDAEAALFANLGWESPRQIADRILALPDISPTGTLTRLYLENLRLAARIRLEQPSVLWSPAHGDGIHRLEAVYNIFSDGMRPGASGRFAASKDTWQIPYLLIDDAVVDGLLDDKHLGRPLFAARMVSDFLTDKSINPGMLVARSLRGVLGKTAAAGLLKRQELFLEDSMLTVMFGQRPPEIDIKPRTVQELAAFCEGQAAVAQESANEYGFVGRDLDIQAIEWPLLTHADHNELLVQGMAGVGKSAMLRHLAWWWQRTGLVGEVFAFSYKDRAWTSAQIIRDVQTRLLTKGDQAQAETMPEPAQLEQAVQLLRANRHLIILDNAESITATSAVISHALDPGEQDRVKTLLSRLRGGKTLVLIGSREAEAWLAPESFGDNLYSLVGLEHEGASALVRLILDRHGATRWLADDAERDALDKLVKLLGGYPLAMTVVLPVLADVAPSAVLADLQAGGTSCDPVGLITSAIEYSLGKLDPALQATLLLLAPFTGAIPTGPTLGQYRDLLLQHSAVLANRPTDLASAVAEAIRVGLATTSNVKNGVHVQPVLPYFLRSRLRQQDEDLYALVSQAHYELYAGLGRGLIDLLDSRGDPQGRALGQSATRADYVNLTAALSHGLTTGQPIGTLIEPLEEYLSQTKQQTARSILLDDTIARCPQPTTNSQKRELAALHNFAGHAAIDQHRLADAQAHHETELQLFKEAGDRKNQALTHHQLGWVAQEQREFDKAEATYRKALDILLEFGDRRTATATFEALGNLALARGRLEDAEVNYRNALEIRLEFGDQLSAAMTFHNLGNLALARGRLEDAAVNYRNALEIRLAFGDQHAAASTYHNLGSLALEQGRLEEAQVNYGEALSIYVGSGDDRYRAARTYQSLGSLALRQGRLEEAETHYREALDIFLQFGDQHVAADIYGKLGDIAEKQHRYEEAETNYREALDVFLRLGHQDSDQGRDLVLLHYLHRASAANAYLRALPGMAVPEEFADLASAFAWLDTERPRLVAAVAMAADTGRDEIALGLALALSGYFDRRRQFDDWLATSTNGLEAARRLGDRNGEAMTLGNSGLALREMRRFEEAITAHQAAVEIFRETSDRPSESTELNHLGMALQEVRRFEEAIAAHQAAVEISRETSDRLREGLALNDLGTALQGVRRFDEAIAAHKNAAAILVEIGERRGEGVAHNYLGLALRGVRRFDEAIAAHREAAVIFRETGDRYHEGNALTNAGKALQAAGRFDEAIAAHQDAAAGFQEAGNRNGVAAALISLGSAMQEAQRFDDAIAAYTKAADTFRDTGERQAEGRALHRVGATLQEVQRFEQAIVPYQNAVEIFRETGDRKGEGGALTDLGVALLRARRFEEAITQLRTAVGIFRETGDRNPEGVALNNFGIALREVQRFEQAIAAHQEAAARCQEAGNPNGLAAALINLGNAMQEAQRLDDAIAAYTKAVEIFRETGDRRFEGIALHALEAARAERHA